MTPKPLTTRYASMMRGDTHLGRSKAGEKSLLSWAGSDWQIPRELDDVPWQRTPVLPKAGQARWMARNPLMTAAKTAVFSIPTNHDSGPAAGSTENDPSNWSPSWHLGGPVTKALTAPALASILGHALRVLTKVFMEEA